MSRTYRKPLWWNNPWHGPSVHMFRRGPRRGGLRRILSAVDQMGADTPNRLLVQYRMLRNYEFDDFHQNCFRDRHNCLKVKNRQTV